MVQESNCTRYASQRDHITNLAAPLIVIAETATEAAAATLFLNAVCIPALPLNVAAVTPTRVTEACT